MDEVLKIRLRLPARLHGLAHRSRADTCHQAYISGVMSSIARFLSYTGPTGVRVPGLCPELEPFYGEDSTGPNSPQPIQGFLAPSNSTPSPLALGAKAAWCHLREQHPQCEFFNQPLTTVKFDPSLQRTISAHCDALEFEKAQSIAKSKKTPHDAFKGQHTPSLFGEPDDVFGRRGASVMDIHVAGGPTRELFMSNFQWIFSIHRWLGVSQHVLRPLFGVDEEGDELKPVFSWLPKNVRTRNKSVRIKPLSRHGAYLSCSSANLKTGPHDTLLNTILALVNEVRPCSAQSEFEAMFAAILAPLKRHKEAVKRQAHKHNTSRTKASKTNGGNNKTQIWRPDIVIFTGFDGEYRQRAIEIKTQFWSATNYFGTRSKNENPMKRALRIHKQTYCERMRDQDKLLFPLEVDGRHGTSDRCGTTKTPGRKIGPLEKKFLSTEKSMFMVTEMGAMNEALMMFIKELALVVGDQISGTWNLSRSNTVRYQAESQVAFMMRRRIAGNMARAFANHFEQSLRLIGLRNPNKNKPNYFVPVVDRNSIHGSSNMSDIIDEEPLNSPDFAFQRPSNRWRPHMRG